MMHEVLARSANNSLPAAVKRRGAKTGAAAANAKRGNAKRILTLRAVVEKDVSSDWLVGSIPGLQGAMTEAKNKAELKNYLEEIAAELIDLGVKLPAPGTNYGTLEIRVELPA